MVEMLPLIKIVPEYNLTLDPSTGQIGAALGREVVVLSMDEIHKEIATLEEAGNELVNSLDHTTNPPGAYPNRQSAFLHQGYVTNVTYGLLIGLLLLFFALPLLTRLGVL
jgi:tetrahydromethanopterin S-methyltransferase subunit B